MRSWSAVVVEIGEECAGGAVEPIDAGFLRTVGGRAVGILHEEAVGKSAGLAEIDIVEAVAIDVADGHAVAAVDIHVVSALDAPEPMVEAVGELIAIGGVMLQGRAGHVGEPRLAGGNRFLVVEHADRGEAWRIGIGESPLTFVGRVELNNARRPADEAVSRHFQQ